jgi:hypothetical protein
MRNNQEALKIILRGFNCPGFKPGAIVIFS